MLVVLGVQGSRSRLGEECWFDDEEEEDEGEVTDGVMKRARSAAFWDVERRRERSCVSGAFLP